LRVARRNPGDLAYVVGACSEHGSSPSPRSQSAPRSRRPRARASASRPSSRAARHGFGIAATADATGLTTLLTSSGGQGPRLYEHPAGGPWSAATALPGDPRSVAGPVLDAAGRGALAIAWRVDVPRHYSGIDVAVRDPGGALGQPVQVAGPEAGGVRHPALAIDGRGTPSWPTTSGRVPPTSIAVADSDRPPLRRRRLLAADGRRPSRVERAAVALGPDGTGIVAWTHRHGVYAVSVEPSGRLGKVKRIASPGSVTSLVAAAGRDAAATLAWIGAHRVGQGRTARTSREVHAMGRTAGHTFARVSTVASTTDFLRTLSVAADEDDQVTLAWSREHFGDDHSVGTNGITSVVLATTAAAGERFPAPQTVASGGRLYRGTPAVTAADGRVAMSWGFQAGRNDFGVQAVVGRPPALGPPQTLARFSDVPSYGGLPPSVPTLAPAGVATVVYVASVGKPPRCRLSGCWPPTAPDQRSSRNSRHA
jgi:hypothetical protein